MNTKLIEGYINAVKTFLPGQQQDDITRELLEDIHMRIEAREAELDRPLTDAEQEALLKKLGHPALVAGRYSSDTRSVAFGRQLIGPMLFPLYLKVLAVAVSLAFFGALLATYILGEFGLGSFGEALRAGLVNFAIVTVIFSLVQYQLTRFPDQWDVRDPLGGWPQVKDPQAVSRFDVIVELVIAAVVLAWLWSLRGSSFEFGPLAFTDSVRRAYDWVLVVSALNLIPPVVNLFQPRWLAFRYGARALLNLVSIGLLAFLLRGGEWVVFTGSDGVAELFANVNQWIGYGLWIAIAIAGLETLYDLYRLFKIFSRRPPVNLAGAALP